MSGSRRPFGAAGWLAAALLAVPAGCTNSGVVGVERSAVALEPSAAAPEPSAAPPEPSAAPPEPPPSVAGAAAPPDAAMPDPDAAECPQSCPALGLICDRARQFCVECLANDDCNWPGGVPWCDTERGVCVACLDQSGCPPGARCVRGDCHFCPDSRVPQVCEGPSRCVGKTCAPPRGRQDPGRNARQPGGG